MNKLRLLIVDDHSVMRESLRMVLEDTGDITITGEAEDGNAALAACRSNTYDVILLDIRLPDLPGYEIAQALRAEGCRAKIIALSMRDEKSIQEQMIEAGADAFVSKADGSVRLIEAIRACVA